jgi:hypothetical protein
MQDDAHRPPVNLETLVQLLAARSALITCDELSNLLVIKLPGSAGLTPVAVDEARPILREFVASLISG